MTIAIVDYGMGNLRSVLHAFRAVGSEAELVADPAGIAGASHVVVPGVGAFPDAMDLLDGRGWTSAIRDAAGAGLPVLGICLGMQLLAGSGTEHGDRHGLGLIAGSIERIPDAAGLRIPHVGWNSVTPASSSELFAETPADTDFYFVHSYVFVPDDPAVVAATCDYGSELVVAVEQGNVMGVQFHPEKSQRMGLALLERFSRQAPC